MHYWSSCKSSATHRICQVEVRLIWWCGGRCWHMTRSLFCLNVFSRRPASLAFSRAYRRPTQPATKWVMLKLNMIIIHHFVKTCSPTTTTIQIFWYHSRAEIVHVNWPCNFPPRVDSLSVQAVYSLLQGYKNILTWYLNVLFYFTINKKCNANVYPQSDCHHNFMIFG